jgi:hypothetical protein
MRRLGLLEDPQSAAALESLCDRRGLDPTVARALVAAVRSQAGRLRRRGLGDQFDQLLGGPEAPGP